MITLTTEPARTDLTNRECAKVLSAVIYPAVGRFGPDTVRAVLEFLTSEDSPLAIIGQEKMTREELLDFCERRKVALPTAGHKDCELFIGSIAGGLCNMALHSTVRDSLEWAKENFHRMLGAI